MSKQDKTTGALEMIALRNAFYRDGYLRMLSGFLMLLVVNGILFGAIIYKIVFPPAPEYFAVTSDGRMINWHPLTDPSVSDSFVTQWAANAVKKVFSLDYIHWRQQLQEASVNFTPYGWKNFMPSLKKTNNLKTLISQKMVSDVELTKAPTVSNALVLDGRYAWKIDMSVLVTFTNGNTKIPQPYDVTLVVLRVPVQDNPNRIEINNFLPVPTASDSGNGLLG